MELRFHNDRFILPRSLPDAWKRQMELRHLVLPEWDRHEQAYLYDEGEEEARALRFLRDAYRVPFDLDADERLERLIDLYHLRSEDERQRDLWPLLRNYQQEGVRFIEWNKRVLLADAMGLGKTLQALAALERMDAFPALVIAPASVKLGWQQEVLKWMPWRSSQVLMSGRDPIDDVDVLVVNSELLPSTHEDLEAHGFESIVMDEAHHFKNPRAQRTRLVDRLAIDMPVRIALTGTPIPNTRHDLIQQLRLLGQLEHVLAPYRGVLPHWWTPEQGPLRHEYARAAVDRLPRHELNERLKATCMIRRTKRSVGRQLPRFERVRRELPAEQRKAYAKAEAAFKTWVDDLRDADDNEWGKAMFAGRQHLARLRREAALSKVAAVVEWAGDMKDAGEKVVVFCHHRAVAHRFAKSLPGKAALVTGETPTRERQRLVGAFEELDFFVATMDTMGQGVDGLQHEASHLAFVELDWTPTKHEQCEGRLHRLGQSDPVTAWYFTAADTIEGAMLRRIDAKWRDVQGIVDGKNVDSFMDGVVGKLMSTGDSDEDGEFSAEA